MNRFRQGDKVSVNFEQYDNRPGVVVDINDQKGLYLIELADGNKTTCIIGKDGKLHEYNPTPPTNSSSSDGPEINALTISFVIITWLLRVIWNIVAGFFRITSRTIKRRTADRFLSLYGMMALVIGIAIHSFQQTNNWYSLENLHRLLTVGEYIIWLAGAVVFIYLYAKKVYPFDIENAPVDIVVPGYIHK